MSDTISSKNDLGALAVHERLAAALSGAIAAGTYGPGDRLPTHRALARQFSVSIGSVTRAIDSLGAQGLVRSEVGRGTFVAERPWSEAAAGPIDLAINAPTPVVTPEQLNAASLLATQRLLRLGNGGYVDPVGTGEQRAVLADWLGRLRAPLAAEEIILCNGAQQGLHLAMGVLKDQFGVVVTERASFPGAIAAATNLGLALQAVTYDEEGPVPEALDRVLAETGPAMVYLTAICQNPLGYETGPERRAALAAVVARHGGYIIEDDIYGLYAAKGGPLYRQILPERTFYVTGLSKSLTPLLRLGVVAPPPEFAAAMRRRLRAECWGLPPVAVEIAVALIEQGSADLAVHSLRREAAERVVLAGEVLQSGPLPMPDGAPHIWLRLAPLRAEQIARRASEAGVRLGAPAAMQVGPEPVDGLRLCLMSPSQPALRRGLEVVARLLAEDEDVVV